ncbi:DnaD domain protein [Solibacillus sp. CAU 1738]|uniref:DnaD domain protein n=1 Tax=Solibacillus sp. CAU 1738 TaxID=3140363 RepID=UPI003261609F
MINQLHPYDTCEIRCPHEFSLESQKVLQLCYQPIIGVEAVALYLKFWAEAEQSSPTFHHHYLLDSLGFSIKQLFQARITLEAIGLLQSFSKASISATHYVYKLKRPLEASEFFADSILSVSLMRKIDRKAYQSLQDALVKREQSIQGFTEVTRSFNDVFLNVTEAELQNIEQFFPQQMGSTSSKSYPFEYDLFDFKLFMDGMSNSLVPSKLFTLDIKITIAKVAFLYNYSVTDMQKIVLMALNEDGSLSTTMIEKNAEDFYQLSSSGNVPKLLKRYEVDNVNVEQPVQKASSKEEHIRYLDTTSPIKVYEDMNGVLPSEATVMQFNDFLRQGISYGVLNTLIQYIAMSDGKLDYGAKLLQSIVDNWVSKGATNAAEAIRIATLEHDKRQGTGPTIRKVDRIPEQNIPDYVKDYELSTPYEFLKILTKGKEPFKGQIRIAESLVKSYGIAQGVANVIVQYVWNETNGKLPEKFVESVASEMRQKNIQSAEEALQYIEQRGTIPYKIGQDALGEFALSPQALVYDKTTPYEFLKQLYGGKEPVRFTVELAEQLVLAQKMPIGVVNYLMEYAMRETNGKMTKNYIQAVASNWLAHNLKSAADAIQLVEQEQAPKTKHKVTMDTPLAFKAQQKNLDNWLPRYDEVIPYEFLKGLKKGDEPLPYIVEMAENYVLTGGMTVGVVNALFEYVIVKSGRINKKFIDTLAFNVQMQNIMLAKDALQYFEQNNQKANVATITQANLLQFYPQNYEFADAESKYEKQTPYEFIKQLNNGQEPFDYTVKAAEKLITQYSMTPAVVNYLLEYVLEKTDGALPEKYINSVADSWRRNNLQTLGQAKDYVKRSEQKATVKKGVKVERVPEWFHKKEDLIETKNSEPASQDHVDLEAEHKKLLEQLRNYDGKVN